MKYIDLFAGIGGFRLGIERAFNNRLSRSGQQGREKKSENENPQGLGSESQSRNDLGSEYATCVYTNEWDKYAADIYDKRFNTTIDRSDLTTVDAASIPDHDLLCGGFPCQAFSVAGKRRGFEDTRGTLFFDIARILKAKRPTYLLLENVKGLLSHDNNRTFQTILWTLDELGYDLQWQVLNSKNFGVPQNRERVFIIGHLRGERKPKVFPIQSNYGEDKGEHTSNAITANYWKGIDNHGQRTHVQVRREPLKFLQRNQRNIEGDYSFTIDSANTGGVSVEGAIRRLTPIECERLQGFPDNWTEGISDTQRYKTLGNAVTVNVVEEIIKRLSL